MRSYLEIFLLTILISCGSKPPETEGQPGDSSSSAESLRQSGASASSDFPYRLLQPAENLKLPDELAEISGIDVYRKGKLVCVNDEKGKVYIYDVKKDELKQGIDFGKKGDYEGIVNVNDTIYVLSSNGNLSRITGFETPEQKTLEFKTSLNEQNDTEGLCFDKKHRRLLIACKKDPGNGLKGVRAIYAVDLKSMELVPQPVYLIRLEALKNFLLANDKQKLIIQDVQSFFDPGKGDLTFQPSEVAIHPLTDEIYLISSVGNLLVVMSRGGEILQVRSLDPGLFKQPEGLCFAENGDMFISDEGRSGKGNILVFTYAPHGGK
jgi:uncharacterized protein YjiK